MKYKNVSWSDDKTGSAEGLSTQSTEPGTPGRDRQQSWSSGNALPPIEARPLQSLPPLTRPAGLDSFDWLPFYGVVRSSLKDEYGLTDVVLEATRCDESAGAACAVLDPAAGEMIAFVTRALATAVGCTPQRAVQCKWSSLVLPDDQVLNARLNRDEIQRMQEFLGVAAEKDLPGIVLFMLHERRGGHRFWGLTHVARVVFDDKSLVFVYLETLRLPSLDLLEGATPTVESSAVVADFLRKLRVSLSIASDARSCARTVEKAFNIFLKDRKGCGCDKNESRAPIVNGVSDAAVAFERQGVWDSMIRALERGSMSSHTSRVDVASCVGTAWCVADTAFGDLPLIYVSPQFEEITGYEHTWAIGRNCRFLQPRDDGRNEAFNGTERQRMRDFLRHRKGKLVSLLMNQKQSGELFWNLLVMDSLCVRGHPYIVSAMMNIAVHQEFLSLMNTWDHRSLAYVQQLRHVIKQQEQNLSVSPSSAASNETVIAECFGDWSSSIATELQDFWEGDHFVPPVGGRAVSEFEGSWASIMDIVEQSISKMYNIRDASLVNMRDNVDGGVCCAVSDPCAPDCPLVFISKEFEKMTGYSCDFALGRNCRFLQPNERSLNIRLNGDEVALMRGFCAHLQTHRVGASMVNLLLNETKQGNRFWNLLHMTHVDVAGRRYILGVQTVLDLPLPGGLATKQESSYVDAGVIAELCSFLSELRGRVHNMANTDDLSISELSDEMHASIHSWMKAMLTDDFEGDHHVPKKGLADAEMFEKDRQWKKVFAEVAADLTAIWEATEDTYAKTADDRTGSVCCAVADPLAADCALVYMSKGFEALTGYHRDWGLGRNCRFLQPNDRSYNNAFNLAERTRMREFCTRPSQDGRLLNVLVNEGRDGYPFWNVLVLKHVQVDGHPYIFGVQTNVLQHRQLLGELLSGGSEAFAELGRLRSVLRARAAQIGTYSLVRLISEGLSEWMSRVPDFMVVPTFPVKLMKRASLPTICLELTKTTPVQTVLVSALEDGVRHFHINFTSACSNLTFDVECRLFSLRVVEALAIVRQKHLHYLRDSICFSVRTKPSQFSVCMECLNFLSVHKHNVGLLLLDISNVNIEGAKKTWMQIERLVRTGDIKSAGVAGGGAIEFATLARLGLKPAVYALDLSPGANMRKDLSDHVNNLMRSDVLLLACNPFGPKNNLLKNATLKSIAATEQIDTAMLLLKWAEGMGHIPVVPFLRSSAVPTAKMAGHVSIGTHRSFMREYIGAGMAEHIATTVNAYFSMPIKDLATKYHVSVSLDKTCDSFPAAVAKRRPKRRTTEPAKAKTSGGKATIMRDIKSREAGVVQVDHSSARVQRNNARNRRPTRSLTIERQPSKREQGCFNPVEHQTARHSVHENHVAGIPTPPKIPTVRFKRPIPFVDVTNTTAAVPRDDRRKLEVPRKSLAQVGAEPPLGRFTSPRGATARPTPSRHPAPYPPGAGSPRCGQRIQSNRAKVATSGQQTTSSKSSRECKERELERREAELQHREKRLREREDRLAQSEAVVLPLLTPRR